jgi:eukaryotic-like serine/threonine-protein kinase
MIGETLGSYLIEQALGSGGMGEVFLGVHRRIGRRVAVKLLMPEYSGSPSLLNRFFTEARATSVINHPGIVQIHDCDIHPSGRAYIIMEYLHGESLRTALERVKVMGHDLRTVVDIVAQAAEAVGAAHGKGIIHRDLKPDNVFLVPGEGGRVLVKIVDFGVAKLAAREGTEAAPSRTRTGSLLGTPLYMSPEQCRSAGTVDHRSDIYSLGCIFFEMVCGRPPFEGPGITDLLIAHASHAPASPRALGIEVPAEVEALMLRMLAKEPADRPGSMADIAASLRGMFARLPRTTVPFRVEPPALPEVRSVPLPAYSTPRPNQATPHHATPPTGTLDQSTGTLDSSPGSVRKGGRRTFVVLSVLALAGVAVYFGFGDRLVQSMRGAPAAPPTAEHAPAKPPQTNVEPPPPPPVEAATVTMDIDRAPEGLELLVDGKPGKFPLQFPRDGGAHRLDFQVPGYEPESRMVEATHSQILKLSLKKLEKPEKGKGRRRNPKGGNNPPPIIDI